jgi:ABC-type lipoprotein export system ATPase subunit
MSVIVLSDVSKTYRTRAGQVKALDGLTLEIPTGQFVAVRGPSGSGKTTLLMVIAGMLRPSAGTVAVGGQDVFALGQQERARFRARTIGFVFQMFHLVPYLNIAENVRLATRADGVNHSSEVPQLLERLGLAGRATHKPAELSAGEKQRTAIARALLNRPKVILADEPTGNLDPENAGMVMRHLADFQQAGGTVVVATHGPAADDFATRVISLRDGRPDETK